MNISVNPTPTTKTLTQIYDEAYVKRHGDIGYSSSYIGHQDGLAAVARHALSTSPAVGKVTEALESCHRNSYYDLDNNLCHSYHFDETLVREALAALEAELNKNHE